MPAHLPALPARPAAPDARRVPLSRIRRTTRGVALGTALGLAVGASALVVGARDAAAQRPRLPVPRDSSRRATLPAESAREVAALYNATGATRVSGPYRLAAGQTITGDLAVLGGPVTIAGRVTGRVTVVNGDLTLMPGAIVDGDIAVAGGVVEGRNVATLRGELTVYRQALAYEVVDGRLVPDLEDDERQGAWIRLPGTRDDDRAVSTRLRLTTGGTYNRVEGLPIIGGPSIRWRFDGGQVRLDALGIYRTVGGFSPTSADLGHDARLEVRFGGAQTVRFAGRLYDVVVPVEDWQLTASESGLGTFLLHRDYRDWYGRHGASFATVLRASRDVSFGVTYADERWAARETRDPFTLFRDRQPWRPNPLADEARVHLTNATLRVDTRTDVDSPWAGWYALADYEYGSGRFSLFAPLSSDALAGPQLHSEPRVVPGAGERRSYQRGFLDLRRYNRLGPDAQLNFRVVTGGWLGGDPLPAQRRLSVTGPGALPGFDFRAPVVTSGEDRGTCASGPSDVPPGLPAQCDRILVGQVEFRNDIRVGLFGDDAPSSRRLRGFRRTASWVLFADAGRGWRVRQALGDASGAVPAFGRGELPPLGSFLADVGAGVDFGHGRATGDVGSFGLYVAKSVSRPEQAANFFVRVRRRF